jgi:hypothetical protein
LSSSTVPAVTCDTTAAFSLGSARTLARAAVTRTDPVVCAPARANSPVPSARTIVIVRSLDINGDESSLR